MKEDTFSLVSSLEANYLHIKLKEPVRLDDIAVHVIKEDCPEFLIPFRIVNINDAVTLKYKLVNTVALEYSDKNLGKREFVKLYLNLLTPFIRGKDWFLDYHYFCIDARYIFLDKQSTGAAFIYVPEKSYLNSDEDILRFFQDTFTGITILDDASFQVKLYRYFSRKDITLSDLYQILLQESQNAGNGDAPASPSGQASSYARSVLPGDAVGRSVPGGEHNLSFQGESGLSVSGRMAFQGEPGLSSAGVQAELPFQMGIKPAVEGKLPFQKGAKPAAEGKLPFQNVVKPAVEGKLPFQKGAKSAVEGKLPFQKGAKPAAEGKQSLQKEPEAAGAPFDNDSDDAVMEALFGSGKKKKGKAARQPAEAKPEKAKTEKGKQEKKKEGGFHLFGKKQEQPAAPQPVSKAVSKEPFQENPRPDFGCFVPIEEGGEQTEIFDGGGSVSACLELIDSPIPGAVPRIALDFTGSFIVLGRMSSDEVQPDIAFGRAFSHIGRRHARIERTDGEYYVIDLGSANHTLLNNQVLIPNQAYPLTEGSILTLTTSRPVRYRVYL